MPPRRGSSTPTHWSGARYLRIRHAEEARAPGRLRPWIAQGHPGATRLPLLDQTLGSLECTVVQTLSVGDHELFIARVDALQIKGESEADPLLYYRRQYLRVDHGTPSPVEGKNEP